MKNLKKILIIASFLIFAFSNLAFADTYHKNTKMDVINYIFNVDLYDKQIK